MPGRYASISLKRQAHKALKELLDAKGQILTAEYDINPLKYLFCKSSGKVTKLLDL